MPSVRDCKHIHYQLPRWLVTKSMFRKSALRCYVTRSARLFSQKETNRRTLQNFLTTMQQSVAHRSFYGREWMNSEKERQDVLILNPYFYYFSSLSPKVICAHYYKSCVTLSNLKGDRAKDEGIKRKSWTRVGGVQTSPTVVFKKCT